MHKHKHYAVVFVFLACISVFYCTAETGGSLVAGSSNYADLVNLFNEFRDIQRPTITDGIHDYSAAATEKQYGELKTIQSRLAAIEPGSWPVSEQVDYHMVRAEMNALEFYHQVLKPWSRFPTFYLRTRKGTGSTIYDTLPIEDVPVPESKTDEILSMLTSAPKIYEQAKENLMDPVGDNAELAIKWSEDEIAYYDDIVAEVNEQFPDRAPEANRARSAAVAYRDWLIENRDSMTAPAGVGTENYNWWLKNVLLFPYT